MPARKSKRPASHTSEAPACIIVGNLGRDPEVRYSQAGMAICNFSVAVTERVKDGDAWKDATEWFRVVTFGKTAENACRRRRRSAAL